MKLGQLCHLITDGKHGDCRNETNSGYFFLSCKDVMDGYLRFEEGRQIARCDFLETHKRTDLKHGDILLTNSGTIGRLAVARDDPRTARTTFQKSVAILKPDNGLVNSEFLYYSLLDARKRLQELAGGTTQQNLLLRDLRDFDINVPSLPVQKAIAHVLGNLDAKIDLNRRMSETLEAIARAIFKSWFVDFDPVRAKAEGRQPAGMDAETAALFPASFSDDGSGIPRGWGLTTLGDACVFAYGKALKETDRRPGVVPVFGSNGQVGWHDAPLFKGPGIIVGRKGNPGTIKWAETDFYAIDTAFCVMPLQGTSPHYLFHALAGVDLPSLGADSAVPGLNRAMAYMSAILLPAPHVQAAFDRLAVPLRRSHHRYERESRTLVEIRDALLPKLLSGAIRVRDAEKAVEAVV